MTISEFDIRRRIASFLARESTIEQLREHLAPLRFDRDSRLSTEALAVLRPVELWLAEASNGEWTEDDLRTELIPFGMVVVYIGPNGHRVDSNAQMIGRPTITPQELVTTFS